MKDPESRASEIADKEAQLESESNPQRAEELRNEIHGMEINQQQEIAANLGEDFDPGEVRS